MRKELSIFQLHTIIYEKQSVEAIKKELGCGKETLNRCLEYLSEEAREHHQATEILDLAMLRKTTPAELRDKYPSLYQITIASIMASSGPIQSDSLSRTSFSAIHQIILTEGATVEKAARELQVSPHYLRRYLGCFSFQRQEALRFDDLRMLSPVDMIQKLGADYFSPIDVGSVKLQRYSFASIHQQAITPPFKSPSIVASDLGVTLAQLRNYLDKFGVKLDDLMQATPDQMVLKYGSRYYDKWYSETAFDMPSALVAMPPAPVAMPSALVAMPPAPVAMPSAPVAMPPAPVAMPFYPIIPMAPQVNPWMVWFPQPVPVTPVLPLFFNYTQPISTEMVTSKAPEHGLGFFGPGKRRKESEIACPLLGQGPTYHAP